MKKSKLAVIIAFICVFAVVVTGLVITVIYDVSLKPATFQNIVPTSGNGTAHYRYCYNELNDSEKYLYSVIINNIGACPEKIEVPAVSDVDLTKLGYALRNDNPEFFNIGTSNRLYKKGLKTFFETAYDMDAATYSQRLKEVEDIASVIVEGASGYTSVYEKEKYVHDYIINHCSYASPEEGMSYNTIYGCLVEGKASCEGYARTFQYILNKLDIDNRLVTGEHTNDGTNYVNHMWNYVVIDGEGYFVDLTSDDQNLQNSASLRHAYFNVSTNDILINHRNIKEPVPLCTATKYNFFEYEGLLFSVGSGDLFESAVYNAVYMATSKGEKSFELKFISGPVMQQGINALFSEGIIYGAFNENGLPGGSADGQVYYSTDDKMNIISIYL